MGLPRERTLGRYELLIELGRGGMAELFLGRLNGAGGFAKLVAIKRILPHLAQDKQFTEMFLNEGRIAAQLSHPNVCQVFELDEVDGELYLAMEYLDGASWEQLIGAAPRGTALQLTAGVLAQAADGLHYAHTLRDVEGRPTPVVHRDVSPQNLFVTVDGVCKVLDFGVSKMMKDGPRTRSGVIKGKLPYMAPEQIRGDVIDARADVFSLGVCAWEAFTGSRLFDRETDFQIWKAITEEDVPPIQSRWPICPPVLDAVVRRALDRDPERRQATARGFADELRNAAGSTASLGQIADAVRTLCGDRIAARARQVATAVSERRSGPDLARADTALDAPGESQSMLMRRASIAVRRSDSRIPDDAAETRDLEAAGVDDAAATRDLASGRRRSRELDDLAGGSAAVERPGRPRRGHLVTAIVAAGAAAAVTAIVVVAVTRGGNAKQAPVAVAPDAADPTGIDNQLETGFKALEKLDKLRDLQKDLTELRDGLAPLTGVTASDDDEGSAATPPAKPPKRDVAPRDPGRTKQPPAPIPPTNGTPPAPPMAKQEPGTFAIDSKPYATIFVDGSRLGDTPLREPLAPGKHTIRAVLADGRTQTFEIQVASGLETNKGRITW